ncbi:hypothetical protein PSKAS_52650 [Peribacillus sp. N1]
MIKNDAVYYYAEKMSHSSPYGRIILKLYIKVNILEIFLNINNYIRKWEIIT